LIYLGLALHNHQPVGNFPWVFQQAYLQAYLPMLEALEKHPGIRISLHYSGSLLDWLEQNHPDFLSRVARLVGRGQVEIMTGGYYEPILPIIPDEDKLGQIARMTQTCRRLFGSKPAGLWLAERVWEPGLPKILAEAGIEWTVVDDTHFKLVGLEDKDLFGYYLTEEQGYPVKVFATSKYLRYSIPWRSVTEVMEYLRQQATNEVLGSRSKVKASDIGPRTSDIGPPIAVMGDDGEKFGIWPETYKHCWEKEARDKEKGGPPLNTPYLARDNQKGGPPPNSPYLARGGWIEEFFSSLEENQEWLVTIPLGEYARQFPPLGRIYLPCASYDEMLEWALPATKSAQFVNIKHELEKELEDAVQFMRGGYWRHFLVKYPESNQLHKKMLQVHRKVYQAKTRTNTDCGLEDLWRGQCNCPYWHGVFGGLYLADIHAATYRHLIQAENKADAVIHPEQPWLKCEEIDFDMDGREEIVVNGNLLSLYLSPQQGGSLIEWDLRRAAYNLLSTVARRPEAYHQNANIKNQISKNKNEKLVTSIHDKIRVKDDSVLRPESSSGYDFYPRYSLIDHFLSHDVTLEQFASCSYKESGNFANQPYQSEVEKHKSFLKVILKRSDKLHCGDSWLPFEVKKEVIIEAGKEKLQIDYQLSNKGNTIASGIFASEWNINLLGGGHNEQAYYEIKGVPRPHHPLSGEGREVTGVILDDYHLDSSGVLSEVGKISLGNKHLGIKISLVAQPPVTLWRFPVETISNSEAGLEGLYQGSCLLLLLPFELPAGTSQVLNLKWAVEALTPNPLP